MTSVRCSSAIWRATASRESASLNERVEVGVVPWTATRAPRLARWAAMTRPMPREDPVTHVTRLRRKASAMCTGHGTTWHAASGNLPTLAVAGLAVDAHTPRHLYAALAGAGGGVFVSSNGGDTWTRVGAPPVSFPVLTDLLVDPTNSQILHAR